MDFPQKALAQLLQVHPRLSDNILSFSDMTESLPEDDNNNRFGVFILRSADEYFFVPVLARNDVIYPLDMVYFNTDRKFFPLTREVVDLILSAPPTSFGKAEKIPGSVVKNPSLEEFVNPPRTGKFMYASSRLEETLAMAPNHIKQGVKDMITKESELQEPLNRMFGLPNLLETLQPNREDEQHPDEDPGIQMVTDGEGLPDDKVQDILNKGYAFFGDVEHPRFVSLSYQSEPGKDSLELTTNFDDGTAHEFVTKDGEKVRGIIPKRYDSAYTGPIAILEDGTFMRLPEPAPYPTDSSRYRSPEHIPTGFVTSGDSFPSEEVFSRLFEHAPPFALSNITSFPNQDQTIAFMDDNQLIFIGRVNSATRTGPGGNIVTVETTPVSGRHEIHTVKCVDGQDRVTNVTSGTAFLRPSTVCIPVIEGLPEYLETNLNRAHNNMDLQQIATAEETHRLEHDGVEFMLDGDRYQDDPGIMHVLVIDNSIEPETAESIVKRAKDDGRVIYHMSKQADNSFGGVNDGASGIPSYGQSPGEAPRPWPKDSVTKQVKPAVKTNDPSVVEATLISEILQDPNMFGSIESYLPDIADSVDRLGRILLLVRLNSDQIFEEDGDTELTTLISSIKNCFKSLGNNYLKLERLVANAQINS